MIKIVNHSRRTLDIALKQGWQIGVKYTNLRDVKHCKRVYFIDIDWKNYNFRKHLKAVISYTPVLTVARDIVYIDELDSILKEAKILKKYAKDVIIVPKAKELIDNMSLIPEEYILGYSVPTKYGGTIIPPEKFGQRKVHLLGGRPDTQRQLGSILNVVSIDCNRFTLDARYGYYFNGTNFIHHEIGGYDTCLTDSIININKVWEDYHER